MKKAKPIYFNRELSWLAFNERVLGQASESRHPLLERVKFLAISASNLDEFFMVRVGGLKIVSESRFQSRDIAGLTADEQLDAIRGRVRMMYDGQSQCLQSLSQELEKEGIVRVLPRDLTEVDRKRLLARFQSETVAAVTPISFDNTIRLSMLSSARIAVCVRLKNDGSNLLSTLSHQVDVLDEEFLDSNLADAESEAPRGKEDSLHQIPEFRYVLIALGQSQSRFWSLPSDHGYRYVLIEDVVQLFLSEFFPNESVVESTTLRITHNGDVQLVEDKQSDLLAGMEKVIRARQSSGMVRMEMSSDSSDTMRQFLESKLGVASDDVYLVDGPIALNDYFAIAGLKGFPSLNDVPWPPQQDPSLSENIFQAISDGDRMLHHPYQSYDPVVEFVQAAATDADVIAIKQTLYRSGKDSQIAEALMTAAANGKNVTAIVELKARFDEARNIEWAQRLEQAGVDVIYGVRGLKTHAKMCLVVRRERTGIRRYVHFATGNYNESTARLYGDISLFTCDEQLGDDTVHFFNAISGLSVPQPLGKLAAAPINLRHTLMDLINIEIESAKSGDNGEITAKVNSLADKEMIDSLYAASQAGVKIQLNVRGICCLVPGVKGLSENIRVVSIVDRMLEHARIFHFRHGGDNSVYISSADWMGRNLDRRVELMTPVEDTDCKERLLRILNCYFQDNVAATELQTDGSYTAVGKKKRKSVYRAQEQLYDEAIQVFAATSHPNATVFEPHKAASGDRSGS